MNSGKDYKARETEVAQPIMAAGPVGGNQGGDFIVTPFDTTQISSPHNYSNPHAGDPCHPLAAGAHAPAIAFAQNTRDEVRLIGGDGEIAGALAAQPGMKQTTYLAFSKGDSGNGRRRVTVATHDVVGTLCAEDSPHGARGLTGLQTMLSGYIQPVVDTFECGGIGSYSASDNSSPLLRTCPTLQVPSKSGGGQPHAVAVASAVRRLTPVECERLQGFPDNFTAIPWKKQGPEQCPDGPRYKALGNSMAVPVMRWIGERIQVVDDLISVL